VNAIRDARDAGQRYDLVCLDIMMPEMDGHQTLQAIRQIEAAHAIDGLDGVKVIMTTALEDSGNVFGAFREGCEAYLVKPVKKAKLVESIEQLGLPIGQGLTGRADCEGASRLWEQTAGPTKEQWQWQARPN
jgi:two-component system chemotaxis response regulator CheY